METEKRKWVESIASLTENWKDESNNHRTINDLCVQQVNKDSDLKGLRDWVEKNIWGFGERAFYWMWKLVVDQMCPEFNFLEVGVFRGQVLALVQMLAKKVKKFACVYGVSPLSTEGGYWESDYEKDVETIHQQFQLDLPVVYKANSTDKDVLKHFTDVQFSIIYIDGGHDYETVVQDIQNYTPLLKVGGYLIIDDSSNSFDLPIGYFRGHEEVSKAVDEILPPFTNNENFEFLFNVVHNRVWRKIK